MTGHETIDFAGFVSVPDGSWRAEWSNLVGKIGLRCH